MDELIEIVFENVSKEKVFHLLKCLRCDAESIASVGASEDIDFLKNGELNQQAIESIINFSGDVTILIRLKKIKIGEITIPLVLLRLVKYDDQFDVDFNFDHSEIQYLPQSMIIKELHKRISEIAKENGVISWFAGIEPASDEETRYFTNEEIGPLQL